jgi:hypothetical protein
MFIMLNDGGNPEGSGLTRANELLLLQRTFIFDVLAQGVSVTLLADAEFRDAKVTSSRSYMRRVKLKEYNRFCPLYLSRGLTPPRGNGCRTPSGPQPHKRGIP